jgi:2-polyprenyl-3-methyl-5-hydroxy-6-metoxy-1,4-benzoquinol methylase
MSSGQSSDFPEYDGKTVRVWDNLAEWWDNKIGDGNGFQDYLIEPATERLLALKPGERVLDIACGAGRFTRRMATHGVAVLAIDHSEMFIKRAKQRTTDNADKIEYRIVDATDRAALLALGEKQFDAAVCTMALMDMSSIEPMISALPKLLKPGGRFVFSVLHPAFNSLTASLTAKEIYRDGKLVTVSGIEITDYAAATAYMGIGISGQPEPQNYFHRPINMLFNTCFKYGFVLDGMEEPTLPEDLEVKSDSPLNWVRIRSIPPILVARMRLK